MKTELLIKMTIWPGSFEEGSIVHKMRFAGNVHGGARERFNKFMHYWGTAKIWLFPNGKVYSHTSIQKIEAQEIESGTHSEIKEGA